MTNKYFGHPRFHELLEELRQLHNDKNHDYSGEKDPLRNLKQCEDAGVPAWVGVIIRETDKMDRLKSYAAKREFKVKSEGLVDTFKDMAIYALLGIILFEEAQKKVQLPDASGKTSVTVRSTFTDSGTHPLTTEITSTGDFRVDPTLPRIEDDPAED